MGGKGSGITAKHRHKLPRIWSDGAVAKLDRRFRDARQLRAGTEQILADRGHTGDGPAPTLLLRRLAQRTTFFDVLLARDEVELMAGRSIDMQRYLATAAAWLKMATQIGLDRVAGPALSLREQLLRDQAEREARDRANGTEVATQ